MFSQGNNLRVAALVLSLAAVAGAPEAAAGQAAGLVRGVVHDSLSGSMAGVEVRLSKGLTGFERTTTTDPDGSFRFTNVPLDVYELRVEAQGFQPSVRRIEVSSSVPLDVAVTLELASQVSSVTVTPDAPMVDLITAGSRGQISMARIEQMPAPVGSRGLESLLVAFPGFAQNANGAIHPRGAHNQMTFVVDGLVISDQLTGAFANALDSGIVQTAELITGNVPAEFGSKVSGVAVITSRSGVGVDRRLAGDASVSAAGAGTWLGTVEAGGGGSRVGYFGSATAMRTDRFLDRVSLDNLHNSGRFARGFGRIDLMPTSRDMVRLHGMGGRSQFDVANLPSQQRAGQDQHQALYDWAGWASYMRTQGSAATIEVTTGLRYTGARLDPSTGDTPVTASQQRTLSNLTTSGRYTRLIGSHTLRAGADVQRFPVREVFAMGITHPAFNDPASDGFNAALLPHDLTRGGQPFRFSDARTGRQFSGFAQATLRWQVVTLTLGVRHDAYRLLASGQHMQPRLGVAYQLPGSAGVLRASYNRNYQTPPNENLLLSNSPEAAALAPASVRDALGGAYRTIQPERQDVVEAGYQRGLGRLATLDVAVYRKRSRDQQDNNNFFDTGIIFPTSLAALEARGAEVRLTVPTLHGVSGTLSLTAAKATSTPPFTGGLFLGQDAVDLLSSGPFAIDHDQRLSAHATAQYQVNTSLWVSGSVRHDSGLVSNPSDPAEVAADPDFAALLPYVDLTAAVPRVRPRTITDLAAGYDVRQAGRRVWSLRAQVTNLTNRVALYNFQSVFVGTRLVAPRTLAVHVTRHF